MKKGILLLAVGGKGWIGGLYYLKNILFSLSLNDYVMSNYVLHVYCSKENAHVFDAFYKNKNIKFVYASKNALINKLRLLVYIIKNNIKCVFPKAKPLPFSHSIAWIPDFQHNRMPQYFTESEITARTSENNIILKNSEPLVLSSNDALHDLKSFYNVGDKKVYVVHFVSYIEDIISSIDDDFDNSTLEEYNLQSNKYIVTMNQFWQHKNHLVVFQAIEEFFNRNPNSDIVFVFTGELADYRNPAYINKIKKIAESVSLKDKVKILGFVDRKKQISLMKQSLFVIQPSLFEGWGTVLEDSKVLGKTVLLSDVPIHREQKNDNCLLFDPQNSEQLCKLTEETIANPPKSNPLEEGIKKMYDDAKEYSKVFERIVKDLE